MIRTIQEEYEAGREQGKPDQIQVTLLRLFTVVRQEENSQYMASAPTSQRQEACCRVAPAITGPSIGASTMGRAA
jgi:hypothetical protein